MPIKLDKKRLIVPLENAQETELIKEIEVIGVGHLIDLIAYIKKRKNYWIQLSATRHSKNNA